MTSNKTVSHRTRLLRSVLIKPLLKMDQLGIVDTVYLYASTYSEAYTNCDQEEMGRFLELLRELRGSEFVRARVVVDEPSEEPVKLRRLIAGVMPLFLNVVQTERPESFSTFDAFDWRRLFGIVVSPTHPLPTLNPPSGTDSGQGSEASETGSTVDYEPNTKNPKSDGQNVVTP